MTTSDMTSAAEADLAELLANMVNRPVIDKLDAAVKKLGHDFRAAAEGVGTDVGRKFQSVRDLQETVGDRLDEISNAEARAATAIQRILEALTAKLLPSLTSLIDGQQALNEAQRESAQQHRALQAAVDEGRARSERRLEHVDVRLERLVESCVAFDEKARIRFGEFTADERKHRAVADTRISAIEASIVENVRIIKGIIDERARASERHVEQLVRQIEQVSTRCDEFHGRVETQLGAIERNSAGYRIAAERQLGEIEASIARIGSRQDKLMRILYGALGMSAMGVMVLLIEGLRLGVH
ncbi:hypothetical protein FAZ95_01000 [Trinickia violacea]|uniref:Uncharacterized protein n=1 Tax=Trinickia violacea TaxID=2571746 RepID=A0A4P8IM30_9BURK|nr:hypothetical protein [Trinickia violacea]QCP47883.1 hypothetical protein FAZ95_01000 [Trinickia violacea]